MNRPFQTAASTAYLPPFSAVAVRPHLADDGGPSANLSLVGRNLPAWADTDAARAILSRILIERPETRGYDNGCSAFGGVEFKGRAAAELRAIYRQAAEVICLDERALFEAGEPYAAKHDELSAILCSERPDALIERLLEARL